MGRHFNNNGEKINFLLMIGGIILTGLIVSMIVVFWIGTKNNVNQEYADEGTEVGLLEETDDNDLEYVSIDLGKKVNETSNGNNANNDLSTETSENTLANSIENTTSNEKNNNTASTEETKNSENSISNKTDEQKDNNAENDDKSSDTEENIKFSAPVTGEIIREFAPDSLVYSETLDEWVIHNGVDIKADKTTVVKASAKGIVKSIKNDPRYGLTVIVEHSGGYQTLYANLLTAEFVVEGEEIEEGQTIGTIGNTAAFEIEDEYHLHFEITKDGEYVNPLNYIQI